MAGATEGLVLLARVRAGEADAARAAIEARWERADRSPFAAVPGTHLARLQVLTPPARRGRRGARECVLLSADVDAPLAPWLERLRAAPPVSRPPPGGGRRAAGRRARPLRLLPRRVRRGRVPALGRGEPAAGRLLGDRLARRDARRGRCRARASRGARRVRRAHPGHGRGRPACRMAGVEGRVSALERDDIQGNVLRGYGFPFARYLFARVRDDGADAARRWLAAQAGPVTTEEEWSAKPLIAGNLALSFAGLRALRLPGWLLESFPQDFRDGMAARADRLGDAGDGAPTHWDEGLRAGDIHVLVTISGRAESAVGRSAARVSADMERNGFDPGHVQEAGQPSDHREHFGFTDGFGQPAIAGVARNGVPGQGVPIRRRPWHRFRG